MQYLKALKNIIEREILEEADIINIEKDFKVKYFYGDNYSNYIRSYSNLIYYIFEKKNILVISLLEKPYSKHNNYLGLNFKIETKISNEEYKNLFLNVINFEKIYLIKYCQETINKLIFLESNNIYINTNKKVINKETFEIIDITNKKHNIKLKNKNFKLKDYLSDFYLFDQIVEVFFHYSSSDLTNYIDNNKLFKYIENKDLTNFINNDNNNLLFKYSNVSIFINYIIDHSKNVTILNNLSQNLYNSVYLEHKNILTEINNHNSCFYRYFEEELHLSKNDIYIINSNNKEFWIDKVDLNTKLNIIILKEDINIFKKYINLKNNNPYVIDIFRFLNKLNFPLIEIDDIYISIYENCDRKIELNSFLSSYFSFYRKNNNLTDWIYLFALLKLEKVSLFEKIEKEYISDTSYKIKLSNILELSKGKFILSDIEKYIEVIKHVE